MNIDVLYIIKLKFVVSTPQGIRFAVAEYASGRFKSRLMDSIKKVSNLYYKCAFKVSTLLMETKFEPIENKIDSLEGPHYTKPQQRNMSLR